MVFYNFNKNILYQKSRVVHYKDPVPHVPLSV